MLLHASKIPCSRICRYRTLYCLDRIWYALPTDRRSHTHWCIHAYTRTHGKPDTDTRTHTYVYAYE